MSLLRKKLQEKGLKSISIPNVQIVGKYIGKDIKEKNGDLLVWDNRCLMHRVTSYDASKEGRIIRRCTAIDPIKPY